MAKDKEDKKKAKPNDDSLLADVKAFASQLGFAGSSGGDFSDFAPEVANKSIAAKPAANVNKAADVKKGNEAAHNKQGKQNDNKSQQGQQGHNKHQKPQQQNQHQGSQQNNQRQQDGKAQQNNVDPRVKSREWNFGVGPRPGEDRYAYSTYRALFEACRQLAKH